MNETSPTIICIPGQWRDRSDIVASIALRSGGYLFAGMVMMKIGTKENFVLEIHEHDPHLKKAFSIAGRGRLTEDDLQSVGSHSFVLYLVGSNGGSVDSARELLHATNGLLKAGGTAVKIETAGTAHRTDQWAGFCAEDRLGNLLNAYVTYVGSEGTYYTCGMHNLGHPDVVVEARIRPNDAARLLHDFAGYVLIEKPALRDGETFSIDADAPRYRLFHTPCTMHADDTLFHNPFGMWKLVRA